LLFVFCPLGGLGGETALQSGISALQGRTFCLARQNILSSIPQGGKGGNKRVQEEPNNPT